LWQRGGDEVMAIVAYKHMMWRYVMASTEAEIAWQT
jgi:hypothetical protein